MPRARRRLAVSAVVPAVLAAALLAVRTCPAAAPAAGGAKIGYPADGTLFPPDSVAPTVVWSDETPRVGRWTVVVRDDRGADVVSASVDAPRWRPSEDEWKRIKASSAERDAEVAVGGVDPANPDTILSSAHVRIR